MSPAHFDEQLAELGRERDVMSLAEFETLLAARRLPKRATAITFDDGYACNARVAAPILHAHKHPATFFLTTGAIGSELEFWWDELAKLLVETCVPVTALITVGAKQFESTSPHPLFPLKYSKPGTGLRRRDTCDFKFTWISGERCVL